MPEVSIVWDGRVEVRQMPAVPSEGQHIQFTEDHGVWKVKRVIWVFDDFGGKCDCIVDLALVPVPTEAGVES